MVSSVAAAVALALVLLGLAAAAGDSDDGPPVIRRICGRTKSPDAATYDANFVAAMENVSRSIARAGFGFAAAGEAPYKVYAFGQCFGEVNSVDCQLCYSQARVKLPSCLPAAAGRVFLESCFLRYDSRNFSGEATDAFDAIACGGSNASNGERLGRVAGKVVGELRIDEGEYWARAEEEAKGMRVYGAAECWRGIEGRGCEECLNNARKGVLGCVPATDGRAMNAGCYLRYSTTKFYGSGSDGGSHVIRQRLAIALGSIFGSALVIVVAVLIREKRKNRRSGVSSSRSFPDDDASTAIIKAITESHLSFKYEDLQTATGDFHPSNKLGQGGFGSVYKGILRDGREVAVKRLFFNTRQWVDHFFNEVNLISSVQHKNLAKLLGCSVEGPESLLVYEFLRNMSLDHFLFDPLKKKALDWGKRFDIIMGTAEGLAYLHEASEVRIIHRDIKASNILLDEKFRPKIADFGLARHFAEGQSHISTGIAGTLGYMAPEYVINGQLTEKADVYSYGVLVLEIVTGRKNSNPLSAEDHSLTALIWRHYNSETLLEITDPDVKAQCSTEEALRVIHVGLLCTQATPSLRPPMWRVVEMLTGLGRDLPVPTQPPFLNVKGAEGGYASGVSNPSSIPVSVNGMSISVLQGR
ncbi:Cysteine-rich receptor-like protein kinase 2 [Nymphaea thermarum]|nr:Cysteine-rich receptor-like protein kinase 2 [Nymphaea thermarum]